MPRMKAPRGPAPTGERTSVRDVIRRALTERILAGTYKPGDRLVELTVAGEFHASQGSVREALRELEAARLVETEPNRGTRVRVVSAREMREAYLTRGILEEAAACPAAKVFKGAVDELREACEAIIEAAVRGDLSRQAARNTAFHRMIVAAAGNGVLLRLWDSLAFETRTRVRLSRPGADPVRDAHTHRPIVEALERGDGRVAARLLRQHAEFFAPPAESGCE